MSNRGGYRPGAGRKKGSKNKATIAREAVGEVLGVADTETLTAAVHRRGHALLQEMECIARDPTQPVAARIMAARTALPFLLPRQSEPPHQSPGRGTDEIIAQLHAARDRLARMPKLLGGAGK